MADNLTIESPAFDLIRTESGVATHDAIKLLWQTLNFEMGLRRRGVRVNQERLYPKVKTEAPGANQNNMDLENASILLLTGSSNVDITGFRAPSTGESYILFIHNIGTATYTLKNNSASSDSSNRIKSNSGADLSLTQDKTVVLQYLNSLWRELKLV